MKSEYTKKSELPVVRLPLNKYLQLAEGTYCGEAFSEQKSEVKSVPMHVTFQGSLVFSSGSLWSGLSSYCTLWHLTPLETWCDEVYPTMHDDIAIEAGERERGNPIYSHIRHRGNDYVISSGTTITPTWPDLSCAVSIDDFDGTFDNYRGMARKSEFKVFGHLVTATYFSRNNDGEIILVFWRKGKQIDSFCPQLKVMPAHPDDAYEIKAKYEGGWDDAPIILVNGKSVATEINSGATPLNKLKIKRPNKIEQSFGRQLSLF